MLQLKATCVIHQNERAKYRLRSFHSSASSMCNGLTHPAVSPVFESMMAWDKHRDIVKIYLYCRLHCATSVAKWGMERSDDPPPPRRLKVTFPPTVWTLTPWISSVYETELIKSSWLPMYIWALTIKQYHQSLLFQKSAFSLDSHWELHFSNTVKGPKSEENDPLLPEGWLRACAWPAEA